MEHTTDDELIYALQTVENTIFTNACDNLTEKELLACLHFLEVYQERLEQNLESITCESYYEDEEDHQYINPPTCSYLQLVVNNGKTIYEL